MTNSEKPKQKMGFTIIKNNPTDGHKGFGIGSLSLENISPVFIDENYDFLEVYLKIITKALFKLVNLD